MAESMAISIDTPIFHYMLTLPARFGEVCEGWVGILYLWPLKCNLHCGFQAVAADFKNESAVSLTSAVNRHLQEASERKSKGDGNW